MLKKYRNKIKARQRGKKVCKQDKTKGKTDKTGKK